MLNEQIFKMKSLMGIALTESENRHINERALLNEMIVDESQLQSTPEREMLIQTILGNDFEINNHEEFIRSLKTSERKEMLLDYSIEEFKDMKTFKVRGYNAGFAIKDDGDIVSVHNNTGIPGILEALMIVAKENGGRKLDHFDGKLSDLYSKVGFKEVERYPWDDRYAPKDWDYKKYGRPDVVYRVVA